MGGKAYTESEAVGRKCLKCFFFFPEKERVFVTLQECLKCQYEWSAVRARVAFGAMNDYPG